MDDCKVEDGNLFYTSINGVLFYDDETKMCFYPRNRNEDEYTIPDGTEVIDDYCFEKSKLTTIKIPKTVKQIKSNAFYSCENLDDIYIPAGIEIMEDELFDGCSALVNLNFLSKNPESIEINDNVFVGLDKDNCTLWVPFGCKSKYESLAVFGGFASVEELDKDDDDEDLFSELPSNDKEFLAPLIKNKEITLGETLFADLKKIEGYQVSGSTYSKEGMTCIKQAGTRQCKLVQYYDRNTIVPFAKLGLDGKKTIKEWQDYFTKLGFNVNEYEDPHVFSSGSRYVSSAFMAINGSGVYVRVKIFESTRSSQYDPNEAVAIYYIDVYKL